MCAETVSPDPQLIEKTRDIVGLYLNPPVAAAVFAIDEKPQVQALNRSAPTLPMLPTTPARATDDYIRYGTLDLFAALNVATRRSPTASPGCVRHGKRRASREHRRAGPTAPERR